MFGLKRAEQDDAGHCALEEQKLSQALDKFKVYQPIVFGRDLTRCLQLHMNRTSLRFSVGFSEVETGVKTLPERVTEVY